MRRIAIRLAVLAISGSLAACGQVDRLKEHLDKSGAQDKAKERVSGVLEGVKKGGADTTLDVQRAICLWYNGSTMLEVGTLSRASDLFTVWQGEGHIARHISGYEVTGAEESGNGSIVVSGTIEGKPFRIRVVPGEPLSWVKAPQL